MVLQDISKKIVSTLPGVLLIAVAAGALTYGATALVGQTLKPKPARIVTKTVEVTETPKAETPAVVTPSVPAAKTATTNAQVHFRTSKSTSSTNLGDLQAGTVVTLGDDANSLWQQVTVNGQTGYVYKTYLNY